ncbi:MAG: hypothetical protein G01um101438_542 [Parcubacteria group bacterium Gr01-1014_38]|nr:MAG: hypothetical protein G01um101438_542 [Parcubacteria group bacterium Gr01-1014_38]
MWWMQLLDHLLLGTVLLVPWVLFTLLLVPFWQYMRREWIVLLALAALIAGFFLHVVNPRTETLTQATANAILEPYVGAYQDSIRAGQAPLWMNTLGVGLPTLANPYVAYFSPLTTLTLFVRDAATGVTVLVIAHMVVGAVGAYLLVRRAGVSVPGALLAAVPFIFNPWVFRRFGFEIHVTYAIAYAWLPWFWAMLMQFLKTRAVRDAALAGIPVAFLMINVPTVAVVALLGATILAMVEVIRHAAQRTWRPIVRLLFGGTVCLLVAFLVVAPEHVASVELARAQGEKSRLTGRVGEGRWNPVGGWRIRDLTAQEFFRVTLTGPLGKRLLPEQSSPAYFGVPYAPKESFVLLAFVGMSAALVVSSWRRSTLAVHHSVLFLLLANLFVRGLFFNIAWCCFPLFDHAGVFPVVGAILLMPLTIFSGVGIDAILRCSGRVLRWGIRRLSFPRLQSLVLHRRTRGIAWGAGGVVLFAAFGLTAIWKPERIQEARSDPARGLSWSEFTIPKAGKIERTRMPQFQFVREQFGERDRPTRVFCLPDVAMWPGPCLDFLAPAYNLAVVGPAELGWFLPGIQSQPTIAAVQPWETGTFSPFFLRFLQLTGVEYLLAAKPVPSLPLLTDIPWDPFPGSFEVYGFFSGLLQKARHLEWRPDYVTHVFIHAVPNPLPRVSFTDTVIADPSPEELPERVAHVRALQSDVRLDSVSPAPGVWRVSGTVPADGALLFSQLSYPGFRATVNGKAVAPQRAYMFLTAVPVPAGQVTVHLRYAPPAVLLSGLVSLGSTLGLSLWMWRARRAFHLTEA